MDDPSSYGPPGIDDFVAAVLMTLAMMRRLEVLTVSKDNNGHVREADFDNWRKLALSGYNQAAAASAIKVLLSFGWFYFAFPNQSMLVIGGITIIIVYIFAMVNAWRRTTEAAALRKDLHILRRGERGPDADK